MLVIHALNAGEKPEFVQVLEDITITEGEKLNLRVAATATPDPTYR